MLASTLGFCDCKSSLTQSGQLDDGSRQAIFTAARRVYTLLEAAELLTEKPALSETDIIALDVVLEAARDHVSEILLWSERRPGNPPGADIAMQC